MYPKSAINCIECCLHWNWIYDRWTALVTVWARTLYVLAIVALKCNNQFCPFIVIYLLFLVCSVVMLVLHRVANFNVVSVCIDTQSSSTILFICQFEPGLFLHFSIDLDRFGSSWNWVFNWIRWTATWFKSHLLSICSSHSHRSCNWFTTSHGPRRFLSKQSNGRSTALFDSNNWLCTSSGRRIL